MIGTVVGLIIIHVLLNLSLLGDAQVVDTVGITIATFNTELLTFSTCQTSRAGYYFDPTTMTCSVRISTMYCIYYLLCSVLILSAVLHLSSPLFLIYYLVCTAFMISFVLLLSTTIYHFFY